ncbi:hypothetical protein [Litorimonas sp. WD9-15]|uniref:hypothetical protein n=1 Tax=Litorimonas sp. WD9-15 TaxID=3418716 RepID=UPI003CFFE508
MGYNRNLDRHKAAEAEAARQTRLREEGRVPMWTAAEWSAFRMGFLACAMLGLLVGFALISTA